MNLYLVNSLNPFRLEGQKTIIFELLERRGWRVPDYIVVPGGNLGNVSAMGKGLCELRRHGFIDKLPRLVVTQAEGANPFCRMLSAGATELTPVADPQTEATAIRIGNPVNWKKALRVIRATDGLCESVSDAETFEAKAALAGDGIGCEPASATTVAGIRKLRKSGTIQAGADVVAILTGNQLKDSESSLLRRSAEELARQRVSVEADAGKLRAALEELLSSAGVPAGILRAISSQSYSSRSDLPLQPGPFLHGSPRAIVDLTNICARKMPAGTPALLNPAATTLLLARRLSLRP